MSNAAGIRLSLDLFLLLYSSSCEIFFAAKTSEGERVALHLSINCRFGIPKQKYVIIYGAALMADQRVPFCHPQANASLLVDDEARTPHFLI